MEPEKGTKIWASYRAGKYEARTRICGGEAEIILTGALLTETLKWARPTWKALHGHF